MDINARLEQISEMIRRGEPVGITDAIAAIDYQEQLREKRDAAHAAKWWNQVIRWLKNRADELMRDGKEKGNE